MSSEQLVSEITSGLGESLSALAKRVPPRRAGKPVSTSCLVRWILRGSRTPSGERVKLEALRSPGGWLSSHPALMRFFQRLTPTIDDNAEPITRTASQRQNAADRAARQLEQLGI